MSLFGLYFDYFAASSLSTSVEITANVSYSKRNFLWFWSLHKNSCQICVWPQYGNNITSQFLVPLKLSKVSRKEFPTFIISAHRRPQITLEKKFVKKTNHWKNVNMVLLPLLLCQEWKYTYTKITPLLIDSDRISELLSNTNGICIFIPLFCNEVWRPVRHWQYF